MVDFSALFKKKEDSKQHYFGLFLRGDSAVGFLFEIKDGIVSLIAKETCKYSNGWEGILDDIDELLSILENETQIHIDQCIFFVYSYFIDQATQDIKDPYKDVIKRISKELELKPMGYIECHEAIKDMIEKKDASPLNGVLVELDHNHLSYYVYKGGKMIHTDQTPRTDNVVDDLAELFAKNKDHFLLPSKVILYGSNALDKEATEIKDYAWEKDLFIQSPRVHVMKSTDVINGLSNTFMEQMEKEIHGEIQESKVEETVAEPEAEETAPAREEVAPTRPPVRKPTKAEVEDGIPDEAESVGFIIGADIIEDPETKPEPGIHMSESVKESFSDKLSGIKMPKVTLPTFSFGSGNGAKVAVVAAALVLIVGVSGGVEYAFHKANVEIIVPSDKISQAFSLQAPLTASGEGSFNMEKKTITTEQKKSIATSGQREVGEKAKGTVILNNFEDKQISYSAGTKLTVDSVTFVLDSDVTIASASSSVSTIQAQTKEAGVTAEKIGPEGNIDKDKRLSVSGATSRNFAVAKNTFSGGSKKQLKTIAKKDLDTLQKEVLDKEKSNALSEIKAELGPHEKVVSDLTEVKIGKATYSGEVGQEASEVTITANVNVDYYVYDENSLKKEVADRLKTDVPNGFEIDKKKLAYKVDNTTKKSAEVDVNVKGEATVVKTIDKSKVLSKISGKNLEETRRILKEDFSAEDVVFKTNSSPIFFMTSRLPYSIKNIDVTLKSEE